MDDRQLLERVRRGDEEAFATVYARHQSAIYRYALHMCGAAAADDIVQDTFVALLRQPSGYEPSLAYSDVPIGAGHIVRMEVPRASLVLLGVMPADGLNAVQSGTVIADVLVGDDGLARAVRFVHRSVRKEPQR